MTCDGVLGKIGEGMGQTTPARTYPLMCTQVATDGTPVGSTTNSMYQPLTATVPDGAVTERPPVVGVTANAT